MKLLIVTNYFWPEEFRINDLATGLKDIGYEVTVFTGIPNYPSGRFFEGYGFWKNRSEIRDGIKIIRFPLIPRGNGGKLGMMLNYISSAFFSCLYIPWKCRDQYDAIFVFEISPVTVGLPAILLKYLRNIPVVFWVLDLWPESLAATRVTKSTFLLNQVEKLVRFIYKKCDLILASSRGFIESIKNVGGSQLNVGYFPNWVEPDYLVCKAKVNALEVPGFPQGFCIVFAGNIGIAQDFQTIIRAAELLSEHSDIHWVIIGDGRQFNWVKSEIYNKKLAQNVHLLGRYPAVMMPTFFDLADVLLVTLRDDPIFSLTLPGKLQSYMASGKPIIAALNGEGGRLVDESKSGRTCRSGSHQQLAENILELYRMSPSERAQLGLNGKSYCDRYFNRDKLINNLSLQITELTKKN
ncbi:glycosyltransferase family 4 protein [bacterium]|nr:glycosyltransferase family 4 protein [bacterium]